MRINPSVGGTGYIPQASRNGNAFNVQVSFIDDAGNDDS